MRMRLAAGFVLFAPLLMGQLDTNSVTVTASNTANLQPDQVVFSIQVTSGINASLNDIVAALQGTGITIANFTEIIPGVSTSIGTGLPLPAETWLFTLAAPLAKIKDTVAQLTSLQQTIAKQNNGLQMSFSVQGTQISQQLQQSQPCVLGPACKCAYAGSKSGERRGFYAGCDPGHVEQRFDCGFQPGTEL